MLRNVHNFLGLGLIRWTEMSGEFSMDRDRGGAYTGFVGKPEGNKTIWKNQE
jgi:hypothetical protein